MILHIIDGTKIHDLPFTSGQTILQVLQEHGITGVHAPCGGKGLCKKCTVTIHSYPESYSCLACITPAEDEMRVELNYRKRISFSQDSSCVQAPADPGQRGYAAACDVGSQKIVCHLMNLETGSCVGTEIDSNVQRVFGADTRTLSAEEADTLRRLLMQEINTLLDRLCEKAQIPADRVTFLTVVGGSALMRILERQTSADAAIPLHSNTENQDYHINGSVFYAPVLSEELGSDVSACILAANLQAEEKPVLLVDMGMHNKMVLGCGGRYVACSADYGPAFRGSFYDYGANASRGAIAGVTWQKGALKLDILGRSMPVGICGSGVLDSIAIMRRLGIIDGEGWFVPQEQLSPEAAPLVTAVNGEPVFKLTKFSKIYVTQSDVQRFRKVKAAIYAAICILAQEYGIRVADIAKTQLAGGLGTFFNLESSAILGLSPYELTNIVEPLGNAASGGSQSAAMSAQARQALLEIPTQVRCFTLFEHPDFQKFYAEGLRFPSPDLWS